MIILSQCPYKLKDCFNSIPIHSVVQLYFTFLSLKSSTYVQISGDISTPQNDLHLHMCWFCFTPSHARFPHANTIHYMDDVLLVCFNGRELQRLWGYNDMLPGTKITDCHREKSRYLSHKNTWVMVSTFPENFHLLKRPQKLFILSKNIQSR